MPLTKKGKKIKRSMEEQYGKENGERVFYASQNKGTITGTHKERKKAKHHSAPLGDFIEKRMKL